MELWDAKDTPLHAVNHMNYVYMHCQWYNWMRSKRILAAVLTTSCPYSCNEGYTRVAHYEHDLAAAVEGLQHHL